MTDYNSFFHQIKNASEITTVAATPTLTVHANYAANDYVGTSAAAMEFLGCARVDGGGGYITSAHVIDSAVQKVAGELWIFDSDPTPPADSAAWSIADADALRLIGIIPISTYYASALNAVGQSDAQQIAFKCASSSTSLFGCFVTRGAPAYADGDLTFVLRVIQA